MDSFNQRKHATASPDAKLRSYQCSWSDGNKVL